MFVCVWVKNFHYDTFQRSVIIAFSDTSFDSLLSRWVYFLSLLFLLLLCVCVYVDIKELNALQEGGKRKLLKNKQCRKWLLSIYHDIKVEWKVFSALHRHGNYLLWKIDIIRTPLWCIPTKIILKSCIFSISSSNYTRNIL